MEGIINFYKIWLAFIIKQLSIYFEEIEVALLDITIKENEWRKLKLHRIQWTIIEREWELLYRIVFEETTNAAQLRPPNISRRRERALHFNER